MANVKNEDPHPTVTVTASFDSMAMASRPTFFSLLVSLALGTLLLPYLETTLLFVRFFLTKESK